MKTRLPGSLEYDPGWKGQIRSSYAELNIPLERIEQIDSIERAFRPGKAKCRRTFAPISRKGAM